MTIDELRDTVDKILQESVALYDPAKQVIVFIFLLSKSGNSMAIWRRKIPVPDLLQAAYKGHIAETKAGLEPNYPVFVEELVVGLPLCSYTAHVSLPGCPNKRHRKNPPGMWDHRLVGS